MSRCVACAVIPIVSKKISALIISARHHASSRFYDGDNVHLSSSVFDEESSPERPMSAVSGGSFSAIVEMLITEHSKSRKFSSPLWLSSDQAASATFAATVRPNEVGVSIGCGIGNVQVFNASDVEDSDLHFFLLSNPIPSNIVHSLNRAASRSGRLKKKKVMEPRDDFAARTPPRFQSSSVASVSLQVVFLFGRWQMIDDRNVVEHLTAAASPTPNRCSAAVGQGGDNATPPPLDESYCGARDEVFDTSLPSAQQRLAFLRMLVLRGSIPKRNKSLFWIDAEVVKSRRMALVQGGVARDVTGGDSGIVMYNIDQLDFSSSPRSAMFSKQKKKKVLHSHHHHRNLHDDSHFDSPEEDTDDQSVRHAKKGRSEEFVDKDVKEWKAKAAAAAAVQSHARAHDWDSENTQFMISMSASAVDKKQAACSSMAKSFSRHDEHDDDVPSLADECPHFSDVLVSPLPCGRENGREESSSITKRSCFVEIAETEASSSSSWTETQVRVTSSWSVANSPFSSSSAAQRLSPSQTTNSTHQRLSEECSWTSGLLRRLAGDLTSCTLDDPIATNLQDRTTFSIASSTSANHQGYIRVVEPLRLPTPAATRSPDSMQSGISSRGKPSSLSFVLPPLPPVVIALQQQGRLIAESNSSGGEEGGLLFEAVSPQIMAWRIYTLGKYERLLDKYGMQGIVRDSPEADDLVQRRSVVKSLMPREAEKI